MTIPVRVLFTETTNGRRQRVDDFNFYVIDMADLAALIRQSEIDCKDGEHFEIVTDDERLVLYAAANDSRYIHESISSRAQRIRTAWTNLIAHEVSLDSGPPAPTKGSSR